MSWVDIALFSMLGVSVVVGLWRGLVSQMLSLLGWGVAYFAAFWYSPELAPHIPVGARGSSLNVGVAFTAIFLLALLLWGMLTWLAEQVMHASPLSVTDRVLGGVFGLVRGVVIGMVAVTLVGLTPFARTPAWKDSQGAAGLQDVLDGVRPLLPRRWLMRMPVNRGGSQLER